MFPLTDGRSISYFKRFKMELDLFDPPPLPCLPDGYQLLPWHDSLLDSHAEVLFACFHEEIDAAVFPSLGDQRGCQYLMNEMRRRPEFLPEATWLLVSPSGYCGTIQGLRQRPAVGAIQNLGIAPSHRGRGLGQMLLLQALHGFRRAGLARALLEVTAQNDGAIRLYRRLGFRRSKTVYKAVQGPLPRQTIDSAFAAPGNVSWYHI